MGKLSLNTALAAGLLSVLFGACSKHEGDPCGIAHLYSPSPVCSGNDLWVCSGNGMRSGKGVWTRMRCLGAKGCRPAEDDLVACDISGNAAGDPCAYNHLPMNTLEACSALEPNVMLHCSGEHVLVKVPCPGGCTPVNHHHAMCSPTVPRR